MPANLSEIRATLERLQQCNEFEARKCLSYETQVDLNFEERYSKAKNKYLENRLIQLTFEHLRNFDGYSVPLPDIPSEEEQVKHIVDQDDEEVSAKEIKEDSHMETAGTSDVKARSSLSSPEKEKQAKSKSKSVTDQVSSVYFEKCGMSKMSDMSWSSDSSRLKRPSDTVAKKVKICRNGVFMGTYEGELNAEGQRHGTGVLLCDNGNSYEGEWKKDKRDGLGVARYSSGDVYDGQWQRGRRHGHGIMYIELGDTYVGNWKNGLKHGAGTYHWVDGEVDVSWYEEDRRVGEGVRWSANRLKAFRLIRGTRKEELSLDVAYATAERLGLSLEKFEL